MLMTVSPLLQVNNAIQFRLSAVFLSQTNLVMLHPLLHRQEAQEGF